MEPLSNAWEGDPDLGGTIFGDLSVTGGAGVIIGKNITTSDITVNLDHSLKQNPDNEYLKGLKELTKQLEKEYERYNVPEAKRNEINKSIQDLQTEVKDIKPAPKVENLSLSKQKQIDAKTTALIEKIVDSLPETSETISNLIPFLSPFSKLIRGGVESIVDAYKKL